MSPSSGHNRKRNELRVIFGRQFKTTVNNQVDKKKKEYEILKYEKTRKKTEVM